MNSSDFAGSRSWQSASLPGSEVMPSALLRVISRALRAASRAAAAWITLLTTTLASDGMLLEPVLQRLVEQVLDHRAHLGGDQLVLGLRGEFRIRHLAGEHRGEALAAIVAGERDLLLLRAAALLGIAGDLAGERAAEAGEVGAAVALRDGVGEAEHGLVVAVVPPQRAFDRDAVALGLDHDRGGNERGLVAVEIPDEGLDAALVAQLLASSRPRAACRRARSARPN